MSSPNTRDLMNDVAAEIPAKWRVVGIQLGLSPATLDNIQSQTAGRPDSNMCAFEQVFDQWQRRRSSPYTWEVIIAALRTPSVGEDALADRLANVLEVRCRDRSQGATSAETTTKDLFVVGMLTGAGVSIGGGTAGAAVGHFLLQFALQGVLISCAVGAGIGIAGAIGLYLLWRASNTDEESQIEKKDK